ncbi:MAG: carboxypeptidase regulatory-like domain-containing protein [Blastocatellia bacterium]|nr:carboxypeptidase regulatory-like domain-containing protein [Blastocatellia bacterium]
MQFYQLLRALILLAIFSLIAFAQTETGQVTGTVTDATGALLAGATVTVKSVETASERKSATNSEGIYTLPNLQPGFYEIRVSSTGFAAKTLRLQVTVGSRNVLNISLSPGPANAPKQVEDSPDVVVEQLSQAVSTVISEKQIRDLPTLTRDPYALVALSGNVSPGDPTGRGVGLAINGQRAASINFLQDGAVNNNQYSAQIGQRVPLESVQEFRVITGGLSSEYGRASGGVVNVVTKSGTNQWHGTGFGFNRVSALSSNSFDNNAKGLDKGVFTRNQYGYSIGGPAIAEKLYVFNSTEWTKVRSTTPVINIVPSSALIAASAETTRDYFGRFGLASDFPTDNDDNASKLYTKSEIANLFPIIKGGAFDKIKSDTIVFGQVVNNRPGDSGGGDPQNALQSVVRLDYNFSNKETVTFRLGTDRQNLFAGTNSFNPYSGFNTGTQLQNDNLSISLTQAHSARLITQTRLAVNRLKYEQPLGSAGSVPGLYFFGNTTPTLDGYDFALPGYSQTGATGLPFGGPQNVYQAYQDGTFLWRKHAFRFGGLYSYTQDNRAYGAYQTSVQVLGTSFGQALDNLVRGKLYSFTGAIDPAGKYPGDTLRLPAEAPNFSRSNRYHEAAAYINDEWQVRRNVTLNLGVRYEFFSVPRNRNQNLDSNFTLGSGTNLYEQIRNGKVELTSGNATKGFYKSDLNNYAPRVGFAWDVFGDGKTSLRGGYGVAFERVFDNAFASIIQNPPNYAEVALIAGTNISGINITDSNTGPFDETGTLKIPQSNLTAIDANLKTAYARFWNLSLQREVARNIVFSIDYSASEGKDLYAVSNFNRIGSGNVYLKDACTTGNCTARLNTQYADINMLTNQGNSTYQGLTVGVDSRNFLTRGLLFNARYTWATAKDNLSSTLSEGTNNFNLGFLDPFNPDLDKGYADYDIRHRLVVSGVWDIPYKPNFAPTTLTGYAYKHLLSGLSLSGIFSAQTGTPFSVYDCTKSVNNVCMRAVGTTAEGSDNPANASAANRFEYISLSGLSAGSYVNSITGTSIFGPFPSGMTERNSFRGPGNWNLDVAVFKTIRVREYGTLQLRAEAYNVFNHANLFVIGNQTDISRFGYVPAQRNGRRNIQFAIRFIF